MPIKFSSYSAECNFFYMAARENKRLGRSESPTSFENWYILLLKTGM